MPTDQKFVRWGILSTANIARRMVIPAIQASRNGQVVGVASRNAEKGRKFASDLNIPHVFASYDELVTSPEIDAIYNPLPNDGHAPWSIKAMRAGKHVLVEKPMAMNAAEAQQMIEVAKSSNVKLYEAFMYRFHPQHSRVFDLLHAGTVGKVNVINAGFSFSLPRTDTTNVRLIPELGGGGLWDVGCYCVNVIRWMSGEEPDAVSGFGLNGSTGVDEVFVGALHFPSGLIAHFECGLRSFGQQQYTLTGDNGRIQVDLAFRPDDESPPIRVVHPGKSEMITVPAANQYTLMVEDFADAILKGGPTRFSAEEGLKNMRVLDALAQSAREKRLITL